MDNSFEFFVGIDGQNLITKTETMIPAINVNIIQLILLPFLVTHTRKIIQKYRWICLCFLPEKKDTKFSNVHRINRFPLAYQKGY